MREKSKAWIKIARARLPDAVKRAILGRFSDPNHALSADPKDMKELVSRIREIEVMVGEQKKEMQPCERASEAAVRRSAAASRDLSINHVLRPDDLIWVRPGTGVIWNK